jgi:hypothetical protein
MVPIRPTLAEKRLCSLCFDWLLLPALPDAGMTFQGRANTLFTEKPALLNSSRNGWMSNKLKPLFFRISP